MTVGMQPGEHPNFGKLIYHLTLRCFVTTPAQTLEHFCFRSPRTGRLFNSTDKYDEQRRQWGGGLRGNKSTQMLRKRAKAAGQTLSLAAAQKL